MTIARGLYTRFERLIHEAAKFGVVGLIGFVVTEIGYYVLHYPLSMGPLTAVTIATVAATIATFIGNRYWTFRHRQGGGTTREVVMFFALNGVGLLIQYACIGLVNYGLGQTGKIANFVALTVGVGLGTVFRFWSYRKWVWVVPPADLDAVGQVGGPDPVSSFPASVGGTGGGLHDGPGSSR